MEREALDEGGVGGGGGKSPHCHMPHVTCMSSSYPKVSPAVPPLDSHASHRKRHNAQRKSKRQTDSRLFPAYVARGARGTAETEPTASPVVLMGGLVGCVLLPPSVFLDLSLWSFWIVCRYVSRTVIASPAHPSVICRPINPIEPAALARGAKGGKRKRIGYGPESILRTVAPLWLSTSLLHRPSMCFPSSPPLYVSCQSPSRIGKEEGNEQPLLPIPGPHNHKQ